MPRFCLLYTIQHSIILWVNCTDGRGIRGPIFVAEGLAALKTGGRRTLQTVSELPEPATRVPYDPSRAT
jgi:hypothetical protein